MGRPANGYRNADGKRIPGVTTILGRFKDSGGLIHWAWQTGMDGNDYRAVRDRAAEAGTIAHALVECHIKLVTADTDELKEQATADHKALNQQCVEVETAIMDKAEQAYMAYCKWESQTKVEIVAQEMPLVSEVYQFGGTPDAIGTIGGELCLLDWKTSNSVYTDYILQIAAYKALWEENHPDQLISGGFHLLRFSKEAGDFTDHFFGELDDAWTMFRLHREAYELDKLLKKRVK